MQRTPEILLSRTCVQREFNIISPAFDSTEWLLSDNGDEFSAIIEDSTFLEAVRCGKVRFRAGCRMVCDLEVSAWFSPQGVRSKYQVKRVIGVS